MSSNSKPLPCDSNPDLPVAGQRGIPRLGACAYGVTLSVKVLKALLTHACKDTVRKSLLAVRVEHTGEHSYIVVTDGHRLAYLEVKVGKDAREARAKAMRGQSEVCHTIPREAMERAIKVGGGHVTITLNGELAAWGKPASKSEFPVLEQVIVPAKAEAEFPPWRQVVPKAMNLGGPSPVDSSVQCKDSDGKRATIPVWGCNMTYLAQAAEFLAAVTDARLPTGVILAGEDALSPQMIYAESGELEGKGVVLLMPMRV